jgi:predicted acylesterase/phospholipase RssA
MWTAWEAGAWSVLADRFRPDLIVGASGGAWNGWAVAGGATPEELTRQWLDPALAKVMQFGLHRRGFLNPAPFLEFSRELFDRYRPRMSFALTVVQLPSLRTHIVRDREITWKHLAASCAIPFGFPPVEIDGRLYVDGGLRGGLPLWAAEELGARRALALNVLTGPVFRALRTVMRNQAATNSLQVTLLEPSRRLGSIRDALVWNPSNVERWIELGRSDASSITM